jgi:hypothetical protein
VQYTAIEFRNARGIEAGQFNALLGGPIDSPVVVETALPRGSPLLPLDEVTQTPSTENTKTQMAKAEVSISERSVR